MRRVLAEAAARANNYLRTIRERHVGVTQQALVKLPLLGGSLEVMLKIAAAESQS
jgi:hypothetical protein